MLCALPTVSFDRGAATSIGDWCGTEAVAAVHAPQANGDQARRLFMLEGLVPPTTVSALLEAARDGMRFEAELDTVDASATHLALIIKDGEAVDGRLATLLEPLIKERVLPYVRERYGCASCMVADALVRRYLPDERQSLSRHFDVSAFATAIMPLNPGEYRGGLYVQGAPSVDSRKFVEFGAGDMLFHQFDVMHGVQVDAGERYSLVMWFTDSEASMAAGHAPWVLEAAEHGNSDAQFVLAGFYYRGEFGVARDLGEAARWFKQSASAGHPLAQEWMATLHAYGEGVPLDYAKAAEYWRAAAEQEHASSQASLAYAYQCGIVSSARSEPRTCLIYSTGGIATECTAIHSVHCCP
jgi:hypothetical protein